MNTSYRRKLLAIVLAGSLLAAALTGCGAPLRTPEYFGDVSEAVMTALPRVVEVDDLDSTRNGFGYSLSISLVTDSAEPFTSEELDTVAEAIWRALPWEPNTISITAGAETSEGYELVDLRAAAEEFEDLSVTNAGQAGVSLTGMRVRYGEWTKPE